jgi:ATP-dependent Lhr-like helicase
LAQEILNARPYAFLDDAPLEERRTRAVFQRRWLDPETAGDLGTLDAAAIDRVRQEAWPQVENADELHDALVELGFLTASEGASGSPESWENFLHELERDRRAAIMRTATGEPGLWVAAERLPQLEAAFASAFTEPPIAAPESLAKVAWTRDEALVELIRGRLEGLGPVTASEMALAAGLPEADVAAALLKLEAEGFVLRGSFTPGTQQTEWCARRLLARIHSYTLNRLRQEIEPVSSADLIRFLLAWHKVAPGHQVEGPASLAAVIEQLEGFEAPAAAWEGDILPSRVADYDPAWLDALCLSGQIMWARLTPRKPMPERVKASGPVRTTPIALLERKNLATWEPFVTKQPVEEAALSDMGQQVFEFLASRGASFFSDVIEGTGLLRSQAEDALGELVACGFVTADSYTGLRALLTPSTRKTQAARRRRPAYDAANAGRWSLLARQAGKAENGSSLDRELVEKIARTLLRRYGVVFKLLLERETLLPPWRELLRVFHRLEARGEIRGGRFVAGFSGEQFALPEAVNMLRAMRRNPTENSLISVSAADPLNLIGIITPGARLASFAANRLLYRDGVPVAVLESGETRFLVEMDQASQWQAKNALVRRSMPPELRSYLGRSA